MSFDPQDPKWTAYVLGELDDDARSEIDRELATESAPLPQACSDSSMSCGRTIDTWLSFGRTANRALARRCRMGEM